ncbi:MAG: hypothetical protein ACXVBF_13970, partial [Flavisolibacter sp.]
MSFRLPASLNEEKKLPVSISISSTQATASRYSISTTNLREFCKDRAKKSNYICETGFDYWSYFQ